MSSKVHFVYHNFKLGEESGCRSEVTATRVCCIFSKMAAIVIANEF